jgi:Na+/melibiose symporter-like transporter
MRADTIDFDELLTGERRESVYAGVGCVLSKPMQSVALATVPLLMSIYGLVPASPDDPTDTALVVRDGYASAVIGVATAAFLFAAILAIIGVITWLWYPLDRAAIADMRTRLRDMHEKKRVERLSQDGTSKFVER